MVKAKDNSKEVNCISDCINVTNKHVCEKQCGKIRSHPSLECTIECVKHNQKTGSSRKLCKGKCKNNKKVV